MWLSDKPGKQRLAARKQNVAQLHAWRNGVAKMAMAKEMAIS